MKNPLIHLFNALPEDGSKIIVTKEFCVQILAWMRAADPKYTQLDAVDKLLWYLHQQNAIILSYAEVGTDRINFIQRKLNGN
jgi:hypothetical protein